MPLIARATMAGGRPEWKAERDKIDLAAVATRLLGPPPGRRGERGRRLWWRCPFHEDKNPSFAIDPGKPWWNCYGCKEHGDAATLVIKKLGVSFPEALDYLFDRRPAPRGGRSAPPRTLPKPEAPPAPAPRAAPPTGGLTASEAEALVSEAEARLWTPEGAESLAYLTGRGLTHETIKAARLGYAPRVDARTRDGRPYITRGIVIAWRDAGRVVLVKLRQPGNAKPKYAEVYRDWTRPPVLFPDPGNVRAGRPVVLTEGEFDALLLGQEVGEWAAVLTQGSAGAGPDVAALARLMAASAWHVAHDADPAGDKAAALWEAFPKARRLRPPEGKDWTEFHMTGSNRIRYHLMPILGKRGPSWDELASQRWGPGLDDDDATEDDAYAIAERHAIQTENDPP